MAFFRIRTKTKNCNLIFAIIVSVLIIVRSLHKVPELEVTLRSTTMKDGKIQILGPQNDRQRAVVSALKHSWEGYKMYAWGHDTLKPMSKSYNDTLGLGLTIVDSIDTFFIANMQAEYNEAMEWIKKSFDPIVNYNVSLRETTVRVLGGLMSIYHLSGEKDFLTKAIDLGERLLPCFDTKSSIPVSTINLKTSIKNMSVPFTSIADAASIQLEFRALARASKMSFFEAKAAKVSEIIHKLPKDHGLARNSINYSVGRFLDYSQISFGAHGGSYYECLLKQWLQTGKHSSFHYPIDDYKEAIKGANTKLRRQTPNERVVFLAEDGYVLDQSALNKMDHQACFLPGTLLLGFKNGMPEIHRTLARDLLNTCHQMYLQQPTNLAPDATNYLMSDDYDETLIDNFVATENNFNNLRPEFIESLYYFYVITGDRTYQDMGWKIFQSFERYTKVLHGYTSIGNIKDPSDTEPLDNMESFWLSETLKYFYLLFSDNRNEIDLNKFVFTTGAHLMPIYDS